MILPIQLAEALRMFLLRKDRPANSLDEWDVGWQKYQEYLASISSSLPESVLSYALADWHYDHMDHRPPHDSWLQKVEVIESAGNGERGPKGARMILTLLGAYHDGIIEIEYFGIHSYAMHRGSAIFGDWLYDEVRLSDEGNVLHEVEFDKGSLLVVCQDFIHKWLPCN
ncbi:hypothetical protein [Lysobacter sp. 1R34A]|uniref:hypothetical protein n=1 Tax=Lysobacter sp. 1R34A TaxID=3445786 RepID=UPI003EEA0408